jgi:hypothetical protein
MSFKSIAIPSRLATKKGGATKAYVPATSVVTTPRELRTSSGHRYAIGDRLRMASGGREIARGASACLVTAVLPNEGGPLRYRVRSDNENYDRIIEERDLSPASPAELE